MTRPALPPLARWPVAGIAAAVGTLLIATSGRYGYHRDELYFRTAGQHLAWGYPDQPPFVPFLARLMTEIAPGSLVAFRLPSAISAMAVVVLTAVLTREFGGGRGAQSLAAGAVGIGAVMLGAAHLLSTTTFDLLAWVLLLWLMVRIYRTGADRLWVVVGLVAGVGLLCNSLVAFLMAGVVVGLLIVGPRRTFASPWLYVGGVLAIALWAPYVIWQARHGWPQLDVARGIAEGESGTSAPRAAFLPVQLGLISPFLAPIWIAGLVRLFRNPAVRTYRFLAWTYVVLAVVFVATGGKPYYLAGMYPLLLAVGAQPTVDWLRTRSRAAGRALVVGAFALTAVSVPVFLPVLPVKTAIDVGVTDINYDAGEQIGWPTYVAQIEAAASQYIRTSGPPAAFIGHNYGIAGAVDRYGSPLGPPRAYSGHNGYYYWGPPPADTVTIFAVGYDESFLRSLFTTVELAGRLDNGRDLDNDEQGESIFFCHGPREPWSALWLDFKDIG